MFLPVSSVSCLLCLYIIGCSCVITHRHWIQTLIPSNLLLNIYHIVSSKSKADCAIFCQQYPQCLGFAPNKTNGTKSYYLFSSRPEDNLAHWYDGDKIFMMSSVLRCLEKGYIIHTDLGICIKKSDTMMSWWNGRNVCLADGGDLISVNTEDKIGLFTQSYFTNGWTRMFIGGIDDLGWKWVDGTDIDDSIWDDEQPDGANENCLEFKYTNKANDKECTVEMHFVCEIKLT